MSSFMSNLQLPLVTKYLLILNVAVNAIIFLTSCPLGYFSINASDVVQNNQFYRIVSAAFVHVGLLHIFMNMSSLVSLGGSLESSLGSLQFFVLTLYYVLVVGAFYIFLGYLSFWITGDISYLHSSGVGFSGVLFAYAMLEASHTRESSRSVFGLFNVPAKVYPFILLILIQLMMPNISFFGHLGGILCGLSSVYGYLDWLNPSQEGYYALDNSRYLSFLTSDRNFVKYSSKSPSIASSNSGGLAAVFYGIQYVVSAVWNVFMTLLFIIGCPTANINATCAKYYNIAEESVCNCYSCMKLKIQKFCCCLKAFRGMLGGGRSDQYFDENDSGLGESSNISSSSSAGGLESSSLHGIPHTATQRGSGTTNGSYHSLSTVDEEMAIGVGAFGSADKSGATSSSSTKTSTTISGNSGQLSTEEMRKKRLERLNISK